MTHFQLLVLFVTGIYLAECLLWIREEGWLLFAWYKKFSRVRGPLLRLRNLWPAGYVYRFPAAVPPKKFRLSLSEAQTRHEAFQPWAKKLHGWSRALLVLVLLAFVLFVARRGFWLAWGLWAFFFLFVHLTLVWTVWKAWKELYALPKWPQVGKTLLCLVSPWQSSRAFDPLGDGLLREFHPLVVGRLLLEEADFSRWARQWLLELRYPPALEGVPNAPLLLEKTAEAEERKLTQWVKDAGLDPQKLLAPPTPAGPLDQGYCPRCEVTYQQKEGTCKDCGRPLVAFS